jgi:hypothetical protein
MAKSNVSGSGRFPEKANSALVKSAVANFLVEMMLWNKSINHLPTNTDGSESQGQE